MRINQYLFDTDGNYQGVLEETDKVRDQTPLQRAAWLASEALGYVQAGQSDPYLYDVLHEINRLLSVTPDKPAQADLWATDPAPPTYLCLSCGHWYPDDRPADRMNYTCDGCAEVSV